MANYFYFKEKCEYPKDRFYRPSELYPEYMFKDMGISEEKNDVYEMIRNMFIDLELDKDNLGTEKWNPLGRYIKKGQTVLIKPNLVTHKNGAEVNRRKSIEFDLYLVKLMGYDYLKIPTLKNALKDKMLYGGEITSLYSNRLEYCGDINEKIKDFDFEPTGGWKGHIEQI